MTARERRRYWIQERNKQIRIIKSYKAKIQSDLRFEYNKFAKAVEQGQGRGYANTLMISNRIENTIRNIYSTIGVRYALLALEQ